MGKCLAPNEAGGEFFAFYFGRPEASHLLQECLKESRQQSSTISFLLYDQIHILLLRHIIRFPQASGSQSHGAHLHSGTLYWNYAFVFPWLITSIKPVSVMGVPSLHYSSPYLTCNQCLAYGKHLINVPVGRLSKNWRNPNSNVLYLQIVQWYTISWILWLNTPNSREDFKFRCNNIAL